MSSFNTNVFSASGSGVAFISGGTLSGATVTGLAFNSLSALTSNMVTLSVASGIKIAVDRGFNGRTIGLILSNRSVATFTALTASGETTAQVINAPSFSFSFPEVRRLWQLGYV